MTTDVQILAERFVDCWKPRLSSSNLYSLDFSWTSLKTVESLLIDLKLKQQLKSNSVSVFPGASAYLAIVIGRILSPSSLKSRASIDADGRVVLYLNRASAEQLFPLQDELEELILDPEAYLGRSIGPDLSYGIVKSLLPIFVFSICTGEHQGIKADATELNVRELTLSARRQIASSAAEFYQAVFPMEPLGRIPEIYLMLIPSELAEFGPGGLFLALEQLIHYLLDYKISPSQILSFARNLILLDEISMSAIGFILSEIHEPNSQDRSVNAFRSTMAVKGGLIRPGYRRVKELLFGEQDWVEHSPILVEDLDNVFLERSIGLLPWLRLSRTYLTKGLSSGSDRVDDLIRVIAALDWTRALKYSTELFEEDRSDVEILCQQGFLHLENGSTEEALRCVKKLESEPDAAPLFTFQLLKGTVSYFYSDFVGAKKAFTSSLAITGSDDRKKSEALNNLGLTLFAVEAFPAALEKFLEAEQLNPGNMICMLNSFSCYRELKDLEHAEIIKQNMISVAPFERRVFSLMLG